MNNKFIEYCKQHNISVGFLHRIHDNLWDDYLEAEKNKEVEIVLSPYGDMFKIINN